MKTNPRIALLFAATLPVALFASTGADRRIENSARSSYNYHTVLQDQVKVQAHDGVVTLTGTVEDKSGRALAASTVANLPGVVSVDNDIKVQTAIPEYSDAWIALKIRGQLLIKANVSATSTQVDVKNGIVTLTGTVQSLAQKDLTGVYAKEIDHVKSVDNDLVVQAPGSGDTSIGEAVDDASITSLIKYALLSHRSTSALSTGVTTENAVVSITGVADSEVEKVLVTKLAQDTRGVKSVVNDMTVKA